MLAKILCLANAFPCKSISRQRGGEASAAPPGCLEIPILCLLPAFGVGLARRRRRLVGQRGPCAQRWALPPPPSPGAAAERGAEQEPVLFTHQMLGEKEFFQECEMSLR